MTIYKQKLTAEQVRELREQDEIHGIAVFVALKESANHGPFSDEFDEDPTEQEGLVRELADYLYSQHSRWLGVGGTHAPEHTDTVIAEFFAD